MRWRDGVIASESLSERDRELVSWSERECE